MLQYFHNTNLKLIFVKYNCINIIVVKKKKNCEIIFIPALHIFFHVALSKPKNSFKLFSDPLVHFFLIFLFSFSFTFIHTKPHTLHHILVKDFKIFKTRSLARIALLLLLSPAELLSKKSS